MVTPVKVNSRVVAITVVLPTRYQLYVKPVFDATELVSSAVVPPAPKSVTWVKVAAAVNVTSVPSQTSCAGIVGKLIVSLVVTAVVVACPVPAAVGMPVTASTPPVNTPLASILASVKLPSPSKAS